MEQRRMEENWQENLVTTQEGIARIWREVKRIAVLGIKTEAQAGQPAFYVPDATHILGQHVYRKVADIPGGVDMVNVFRRGQDVPPHVDDILKAKPKVVWMQSGIRNDEAARRLAEAGIRVVQDRCAMVEHRRVA